MRTSALYCGDIVHARTDHLARRSFRYPVFMASIDLDELPVLHRELRLFSHDRPNLYALHDRDYEGATDGLAVAHHAALAAADIAPPATTRLVTNLRIAGYVFNPVSFFLGYDTAGELTSVIAEVNNTYGGRFRYVLGPRHRITSGSRSRIGFRHDRELFVSPFLHGPRSYELWFDAPLDAERLVITMHVDTPDGDRLFTARVAGSRRALTDRALVAAALRYPWMTAQVIALIHLEALKLRWLGVPYRRPGPDHRPLPEA